MIAARVAAELSQDPGIEAEVVKGGFLELSVAIDGEKVIDTNRFLYPLPATIVNKTRTLLGGL